MLASVKMLHVKCCQWGDGRTPPLQKGLVCVGKCVGVRQKMLTEKCPNGIEIALIFSKVGNYLAKIQISQEVQWVFELNKLASPLWSVASKNFGTCRNAQVWCPGASFSLNFNKSIHLKDKGEWEFQTVGKGKALPRKKSWLHLNKSVAVFYLQNIRSDDD